MHKLLRKWMLCGIAIIRTQKSNDPIQRVHNIDEEKYS
jgi:hypothetical protein